MQPSNSNQIRTRIESLGVSLPKNLVSNAELMAKMKHALPFDLQELVGIASRGMCQPGEGSVSLAIAAAEDCLRHSNYKADDIDMIINCSITKSDVDSTTNMLEPHLSVLVKEALGLRNARTLDICNACAGIFTAIYILNNFIQRGVIKCGMVVSGEHLTTSTAHALEVVTGVESPEFASLTIGDAGAAVIIERTEETVGSLVLTGFSTHAEYSELCVAMPSKDCPGTYMITDAKGLQKAAA